MALSNYRLCDVCHAKAFYDCGLNWRDAEPDDIAVEYNGSPHYMALDYLGGWAVVCGECSKTHVARVLTRKQEKKIFKKPGKGYERIKKQKCKGQKQ